MQVIGLGLEAQFGFVLGRSTVDAIYSMRISLLRSALGFSRTLGCFNVFFVDFVKAFDTVTTEVLQRACSPRTHTEDRQLGAAVQ
jgi:hypothetical protein